MQPLYQALLDRYLDRDVQVLEQAKVVRAILEATEPFVARDRVDALAQSNGGSFVVQRGRFEWQYARPTQKRTWSDLGDSFTLPEAPLEGCSIAAVDGSQIFPDSRDKYPFAMVRIGEVAMNYGSGKRPVTRQTVYGPDEAVLLEALTGDMTPGERNALIGGFRDHLEMVHAARIMADLEDFGPRVVLVDGPLHPFSPSQAVAEAHDASIAAIIASGAVPCGVVSGGDARYVVRLAGLLANVESDKDWRWVTDRQVFLDLPDGEVTEEFLIASGYNAAATYPIGFVYMRTGSEIVRVEYPVTQTTPTSIRKALRAIWNDSQRLSYPFSLIKAHGLAVIHADERRAYQEQFAGALATYGLYDDSRSVKERLKELS